MLALPLAIGLYLGWKVYIRGAGGLYVQAHQMDVTTGMREFDPDDEPKEKKTLANLPARIFHSFVY